MAGARSMHGVIRNAYKILVGKLEGKMPLKTMAPNRFLPCINFVL
jgi:hypothetical protein